MRLIASSSSLVGLLVAVLVAGMAPVVAADGDPLRSQQYGLDQSSLPAAYAVSTGSGVVIAVLDTGVDLDHPDLKSKLVPGWDFVDDDATPDDLNGHGTHVAGIAAAVTNNGMGIAGASPDARIMPVRVLDADGVGDPDTIAEAIGWAVDHGADVLNMSLGGGTDLLSRIFKGGPMNDAIAAANAAGVVVVVAAGNDTTFINAYQSDTPVLVVNASNESVNPAVFTNFGDPRAVAAAGARIVSTVPLTPTTNWPGGTSGYEELSGTSMATPLVAGVAALLVQPGRSPDDIRQRIIDTAENPDNKARLGAGIVNAAAAVASSPAVGLVDTAQGQWHLRAETGAVTSFFYGNPGDTPIMGDWNCDGIDTPGLYRQSDGFVYLSNANRSQAADIKFFFGNPADVPIAGDFNGNGCDTVSIYRPEEQRFYITNALGPNNGVLPQAEVSYVFGNPGDKPFVGDFDGDGAETVGLHRESTGLVYFRNSHTQGNADTQFVFGDPGDRLVAGDWGIVDGVDTPALFRPSITTFFFRYTNTTGNADSQFVFGEPPWLPVAGNFGLG